MTLYDILRKVDSIESKFEVYICDPSDFDLDDEVMLFDALEFLDPDFPTVEESAGLKLLLAVEELQGVVSNLRNQRVELSEDNLLSAVKYYFERDAYISLG